MKYILVGLVDLVDSYLKPKQEVREYKVYFEHRKDESRFKSKK